jgi:hypothetical protein
MPVDETRAVAKLPHVDIEIRHKMAPEEGAEYLAVTLRATPDFDTAAAFFDPMRLMAAWARWNPWLAWLEIANPLAFRQLGGSARPALDGAKGVRRDAP